MKKLLTVFFVFGFLLLSFVSGINAQKVIKKDGWVLPFDETTTKAGLKKKEIIGNDNTISNLKSIREVDVQFFQLLRPVLVTIDSYIVNENKSIIVKSTNYEVRNYAAYSLYNKVFAYEITYYGVSLSEGRKEYLGCLTSAFYIDEDGDGLFETRYYEIEKVPNWVENVN